MAGCEQLVITSKLSEKQWLWLYTELQQLAADKRPELFNDLTTQWLLKVHKQDRIESTHSHDPAFHYRITAGDSASTLQEVELISKHRHQFAINDTPLMECLKSGKPVVLEGLETNPKLAAQWETLLLPSPYLFLHGNRVDLPNANITFLSGKNNALTGSLLWDHQLKNNNKEQPHSHAVYKLLQSLPICQDKSYPRTPPWSPQEFLRLYHEQIAVEQKN